MTELIQFTLFGLMLGCVYAVAAMGLVLTYTVTGVFNFAHGAVGMLAAFCYYELRVNRGVPTPIAVVIVVFGMAPLAGLAAERLMRRFRSTDYATSLVVTIALTVGLLGLAQQLFDPTVGRNVPPLLGDNQVEILSVPISFDRLGQVAVAILVAFGLRSLLFRTTTGAQMRAVVDDPELASLNGVRSVVVARLSWMIGFVLAAVGGVLFAGGQNLNAVVLTLLVLNAYGAAMIGRLTSLPMTFVGALLLGLIQELTNVTWLWPDSELFSRLRLAIPGLFLVAAVLLVPSFRLSAGRVVGRDQPAVPTVRRALLGAGGLVLAVWTAVTFGPGDLQVHLIRALVIATIALSLVAVTGLSGQVSLAQYLFVGIGAFVAGKVVGGSSVLGLLLGAAVAAGVGALTALPSVRLRGLHLALSSFGVALIGRELILGDPRVFGYLSVQVPRPDLFGLSLSSDAAFAIWCATVFAALGFLVVIVRRSAFGRRLTALRDSEVAAATLGMNVRSAKVAAFALSAFIAGCAGSLFGGFAGSIQALQFDPINSLVIVLFAFVGGITTVSGALLGGLLFALLTWAQTALPEMSGAVFGGVAVLAISLGRQPNGLAGVLLAALGRARDAWNGRTVADPAPDDGPDDGAELGQILVPEPGRAMATVGAER